MGLDGFIQIILGSLLQSSILALATFGIVLIFKTSFTTNFAQGSIASFGAYVMFVVITTVVTKALPEGTTVTPWWVFIVGMLGAVITAFIIGLLVDTMIIRRARQISSAGKQMITMGLVLILTAMTDIVFGVLPKQMPRISAGNNVFTVGENFRISITTHNLFAIIVAFSVIILTFMALRFTKWGLGVRATASNEIISSMMGVNTRFITAISWAVAGSLGALGAALYAPTISTLSSAMMTSMQVNGFLALILGGASTFYGPVIAAIFIPIVSGFIAYFESVWQPIIVYSLILIIILIKPTGIFGKRVQKKV